jgi:hypothetical protein
MIMLQIYMVNDMVVWSMWAPRPAKDWSTLGCRYWERRGDVHLDDNPRTHRELLSLALRAVQDRLGEREDLGGGGV